MVHRAVGAETENVQPVVAPRSDPPATPSVCSGKVSVIAGRSDHRRVLVGLGDLLVLRGRKRPDGRRGARPGRDSAVEPCVAAFRSVDRTRNQSLRMPGVGLPTSEKAIEIRVQQEYERIAERNVYSAHVDKTVHGVMHVLHEHTHGGKINGVQNRRVARGGRRRPSNGSVDRRWRVCGIAGNGTVSVRICSWDIVTVFPPRRCGILPRWTDDLGCGTSVAHEDRCEQIEHPDGASAQVAVRNGPGVLGPIPVVQGELRVDLPKHLLHSIDEFSMPRNECRAAMHVGRLVDLILLEPPGNVARNCVVSGTGEKPAVHFQ